MIVIGENTSPCLDPDPLMNDGIDRSQLTIPIDAKINVLVEGESGTVLSMIY